jgi:HAD superfamily hydrolase (TIGR01484 family)
MQADLRVVIFDLDDTLAESKTAISDRMARSIGRLLDHYIVCIISGGRFEQFEKQVLEHLPVGPERLARLHLMPTCGTRYYRWDGEWRLVYQEDLTPAQKERVVAVLTEGARELDLWEPEAWGDRIEDRGSQVTFSALGQLAPVHAKAAWDPTGVKKAALRAYAAPRLPDLEVRSGGSTSIDVTRKGIDKAFGVRKLVAELGVRLDELLFVGDRLDEGGNDYPVKAMGVRCVAVRGWTDTADYVEQLLRLLPPANGSVNSSVNGSVSG